VCREEELYLSSRSTEVNKSTKQRVPPAAAGHWSRGTSERKDKRTASFVTLLVFGGQVFGGHESRPSGVLRATSREWRGVLKAKEQLVMFSIVSNMLHKRKVQAIL